VHYNIGVNLMDIGQTDLALESYYRALNKDPYYWRASYNLGVHYLRTDRYALAEKMLRKTVSITDQHLESRYNLGLTLLRVNKAEEAKAYFYETLNRNENHTGSLYNIGYIFLEQKQYDSSALYFDKVLEIDNEHVKAMFNLGVISRRKDAYSAAIDWFNKALSLQPEYPEALYNKALCYRDLKDTTAAIEVLERALTQRQNYFSALTFKLELLQHSDRQQEFSHLLDSIASLETTSTATTKILAGIFLEQKRYRQSLAMYTSILQQDSSDITLLLTVADIEKTLGLLDSSLVHIEMALSLRTDSKELLFTHATTALAASDTARAIPSLNAIIELEPSNVEARRTLAEIHLASSEYASAAFEFERIYKLTGKPDILAEAANAYLKSDSYAQALKKYQLLVQKDSTSWTGLYYTALCYDRLGEPELEFKSWQRFSSAFPQDYRGVYQIGKYYFEQKQFTKAIDYLKTSIELQPYDFAYLYLADAQFQVKNYEAALSSIDAFLRDNPDSKRGERLRKSIVKNSSL